MARWAFWATLAAGASVFLTAVGVVLIWRTLAATRAAADHAKDMVVEARTTTKAAIEANAAATAANELSRQAFLAEQRPWVSADFKLDAPITWDANGCSLTLLAVMKNTGRTPALNVSMHIKAYNYFGGDLVGDQLTFADSVRDEPVAIGSALFPGGTARRKYIQRIPKSEVDAVRAFWAARARDIDWMHPVFVGCVQYRSVFDETPHQTGFIRRILRVTGEPIAPSLGDIPLEQLILTRWIDDGRTD